jgi:hypothetical protein
LVIDVPSTPDFSEMECAVVEAFVQTIVERFRQLPGGSREVSITFVRALEQYSVAAHQKENSARFDFRNT